MIKTENSKGSSYEYLHYMYISRIFTFFVHFLKVKYDISSLQLWSNLESFLKYHGSTEYWPAKGNWMQIISRATVLPALIKNMKYNLINWVSCRRSTMNIDNFFHVFFSLSLENWLKFRIGPQKNFPNILLI